MQKKEKKLKEKKWIKPAVTVLRTSEFKAERVLAACGSPTPTNPFCGVMTSTS